MKRFWIGALPFAIALSCALAACGGGGQSSANGASSGSNGATVYMNAANFTTHSVTVKVNEPVHFDDTAGGGGEHILCVGAGNGGTSTCAAAGSVPGAPSNLTGAGVNFQPGNSKDFTFTKVGAYHIICTIHTGMYLDVTVQ